MSRHQSCDRCAELQEEILQLRTELGQRPAVLLQDRVRVLFGLSPQQTMMLSMLYEAPGMVTRSSIHDAFESCVGRRDKESTYPKIVDVVVSLTRTKLHYKFGKPTIQNHWGIGYSLTPEARAWLKRQIDAS